MRLIDADALLDRFEKAGRLLSVYFDIGISPTIRTEDTVIQALTDFQVWLQKQNDPRLHEGPLGKNIIINKDGEWIDAIHAYKEDRKKQLEQFPDYDPRRDLNGTKEESLRETDEKER